ncbi:MAG: helix-turn-helix domain-containing protein, partial [Syntrophomonadaceae bacterium]
ANSVNHNLMSSLPMTLEESVSLAEKNAILEALKHSGGNRKKAAQLLNIHRSLLYKKLRKHNIG